MKDELKSVKRIERALDTAIPLPGGYRIGFDGIIGLIPGVGDLTTTGISSFIVYKAIKLGVPKVIIARMMINMLIDTVLGAIPVVGDIFDFFFKSNVKNARLLQKYAKRPEETEARSAVELALFILVMVGIFAFVIWLTVKLISAVFTAVF